MVSRYSLPVSPPSAPSGEAPLAASRLIWIVLATGGIASAHQEGPLAGRGNRGLGVALPSESGSSFSVWKIRSPTTALGLEVNASWSYRDSTADADDLASAAINRHYLRLQLSPTIKQYRPLHKQIASYTYWQFEAGFSGRNRDDPDSQSGSSGASIGIALGLGVEWFPFQRISVGGQTGLRLGYRYGQYDSRRIDYNRSHTSWDLYLRTFQSELKALMYF